MKKSIFLIVSLILIISLSACGEVEVPSSETEQINEVETATVEEIEPEELSLIDKFVTTFNELSSIPITEITSFEPTDRESGYYRHEYRLDDWDGSVGEVGKVGEHTIEITNYGLCGGFYDENNYLRIYLTTDTIEQMIEKIPALVKALDSSVTEDEIKEVQEGISDTSFSQETFYIADINTILFLKQNNSYQIMLDIKY